MSPHPIRYVCSCVTTGEQLNGFQLNLALGNLKFLAAVQSVLKSENSDDHVTATCLYVRHVESKLLIFNGEKRVSDGTGKAT
jgi:hypothetical protein